MARHKKKLFSSDTDDVSFEELSETAQDVSEMTPEEVPEVISEDVHDTTPEVMRVESFHKKESSRGKHARSIFNPLNVSEASTSEELLESLNAKLDEDAEDFVEALDADTVADEALLDDLAEIFDADSADMFNIELPEITGENTDDTLLGDLPEINDADSFESRIGDLPEISDADSVVLADTNSTDDDFINVVFDNQAAGEVQGSQVSANSDDAYQSEFEQAFFAENTTVINEERKAKNRHSVKIAGIVLACLLVAAYGVGVGVFFGRFFPNTVAEQIDLSVKTVDQASALLEENVKDYQVVVDGKGMNVTIVGSDINFKLDGADIASEMHKSVNPWIWPYEVFQKHDYSDYVEASFDSAVAATVLNEAIAEHNETAIPSENAKLGYNESSGKIAVLSEQYGTELVPELAISKALTGITHADRRVTFDDEDVVPPTVFSDDVGLNKAAENAQSVSGVDLRVMLDDVLAEEINARVYVNWLDIASDYTVSINREKTNDWISTFVDGVNTKGSTRTYTRLDGKVVTVSGGSYGWSVDKNALRNAIDEAIANDTVGTYDVVVYESAQVFNGVGKKDWGDRYIDVDITEQYVRFYDDGEIIWETDCITGAGVNTGRSTPEGVYSVTRKAMNVPLYPYEDGKRVEEPTTVVYWMPFIGNMIGLHDAWWQPYFGGDAYLIGLGSHGCVNLPPEKAAELYDIINVGDVVITHF